MTSLYETDFCKWTEQQADLCRQGRWSELDLEHLSEELTSMGARERRELINRLAILLAHLLKWRYQPQSRGRSWRLTIRLQRLEVADVLRQNPSLRPRVGEFMGDAYRKAILYAAGETGLDEREFPATCPFTLDQILDDDWPEPAATRS